MKLSERTFKPGDRVFSLFTGFASVEESTNPSSAILIGDYLMYKCGTVFRGDKHRSLFTPEEAKELFGVEDTPPKKKVKRWRYIAKLKCGVPFESNYFFSSDEEFMKYNNSADWFQRIEESMREFEE